MGDLLPGTYHFKIPVELGDDESVHDAVLREMKSGNVLYFPPDPVPDKLNHEN